MNLIVLGAAAGGGFPQWNCRCPLCRLAWAKDPRVKARTQSGIAVSADGDRWVLLNASPDLRQQIISTPALHPRGADRGSPIEAVILTNAEVDHVVGLLALRERQPFRLLATTTTHRALDNNSMFDALDRSIVPRDPLAPEKPFNLLKIDFTAFKVPGKVPLYEEGAEVALGEETEHVLGLTIASNGKRCVYVPNCARVTPALLERIEGADILFFDGTTFADDEMVRLGLSPKTAARMGHIAMDGTDGSLAALDGVKVGRRIFIHINNTNPALLDGSLERQTIERAGWELAYDGMELSI